MVKRLVKIAKELNVGTATIVEHLVDKGFDIENKPTAKVSEAMYHELIKEFQKSIAIKEQADQLVIGTRPNGKKENGLVESEVSSVSTLEPIVKEEKKSPTSSNAIPSNKVEAPEPAQEKEEKNKEEVVKVEAPQPKLKVLGKIDLGARLKSKKAKAESKKKQEQKVQPPKEEKEVIENRAEVKEEEVKQPEQPIKEEEQVKEKITLKNTPPSKQSDASKPKNKPKPASTNQEQSKSNLKEPKKTPSVLGTVAPKKESSKSEKEEVTTSKEGSKAPKEGLLRAETPELRGLKILGKIDTDKFKKKKKKKVEEDKNKPRSTDSSGNRDRRGGNQSAPNARGEQARGSNSNSDTRRSGQDRDRGGQGTNNNKSGSNSSNNNNNSNNEGRQRRRRVRRTVSTGGDRSGGPSRQGGNDRNRGGNRRGNNQGGRRAAPDTPKEVSKKEIEEKIKATMARLSGGGRKRRQKLRRENRDRLREKQEAKEQEQKTDKLQLTEFVTVSELASLMDVAVTDVIMTCMNLGVIVSINQRLDAEIIELVADEFNHEVEFISVEEVDNEEEEIVDDPEDLLPRAPIVTVMGHVDHGKTSLLDYIRSANVADGEAGGITQHIGAYEVKVKDGKRITFLDTPGHEAFTAMRARGAKVTDIAIIIIAADDSIMPQTKEAISHAQAAGVPIVFAINKVDKDGAQPERIKQELASMNLLVEEWGGEFQSQDISAKTGMGIDDLLEKVLLEAEMLELKANPDRQAIGTVIEASLDKGRGYVTKLLVQTGTIKIGDPIVAGEYSGKVKAMFNERGKRIKKAGPAAPVLMLGLSGAPQAGDRFKEVDSEQDARQIANKRSQIAREQANRATKRISLDEIGRRLALGNFKELNLIVKGDVDGSVEALSDSLIKQSHETVQVNIIHKAVGQIIESDVLLASASDAIIIGFQVRPSGGARKLAEREGVQIKTYSIIYEAIEEIKKAIEGMLDTIKEEKITAQIEVRNTFKISKVGTIAGCYVQEGRITRNSMIRLIRDGIVVFPIKEGAVGEISSLKRFKDDVKEVKAGLECGLSIKGFNDIKTGDIIEGYEIVEIKQKL